jgi:transposase
MMKFYNSQHQFYCGIDLHAKTLYVCVVDNSGTKRLHKNFQCQDVEGLLEELQPFREDLVVGCESTFNWYWLADLMNHEKIPFILGHALYMKAIHGGKTKSDAIDSEKIARLIRGGNFPLAHAYPKEHRATRDLLRRRTFLVRRRAEAFTHIQMVHHQHNQPKPTNIKYKSNRIGIGEKLPDAHSQMLVDVDLKMIEAYDQQIARLESELIKKAKITHPQLYYRLTSVPGIGPILGLTLMHEIQAIERFPSVGNFLSYCRLVKGSHTSAGKNYGSPGGKMGNAYLRWAFGEAIQILKRESGDVKKLAERLEKKHGKGRAMNTLAVKLGRALYSMLLHDRAFDLKRFVGG